jgi:hypothetical protein
MVVYPQKLLEELPRPALVFGDGAVKYREVFGVDGISFGEENMAVAGASVVARLGQRSFERGEVIDPYRLQPLYMRVTEAEEKWKARMKQGET